MGNCTHIPTLEKALKIIDVNTQDDDEGTVLVYLGVYGCIEVMKLLLSTGADVNAKDNCGYTALIWASLNGRIEVVKLLEGK